MAKGMRIARANILAIMILLLLATLAAYWHVLESDYVNIDDDVNITGNSHVSSGLNKDSVKWAFTTYYAANWHPLTWISHMLDFQLYGSKPMGHHLTNLLFHIANAILLFLVLTRMTGCLWRSAFVAALFALHPLHVESVAWVTERKDVLSTFFWILTMFAYVYYTEKPSLKRYIPVPILMGIGLMAKPMLVTIPFVLLMLDYWPLGRLWPRNTGAEKGRATVRRLILEKLPLIALSAASCVVAYEAQRAGGAVVGTALFPLGNRVTNAMVTYISYLANMIWPVGLSAYYLRPSHPREAWQIIGAGLMLVSISALVIRAGINRRYLLTGWLWYMLTLVPVIGLVQLGIQSKADRFTYIPLIGIFFILAWGLPELFTKRARVHGARERPAQRKAVEAKPKFEPPGPFAIPAVAVLVILAACTWHQVGFWRNSGTLFEHAVEVNPANYTAHNNLGTYLLSEGRTDEAMTHFKEAVRIRPDFSLALFNIALILSRRGSTTEAIDYLTKGLKTMPDDPGAHYSLGQLLSKAGRVDEAIIQYGEALRLKPDYVDAEVNLGMILIQRKQLDEGMEHFAKALRMDPNSGIAHNDLALAFYLKGQYAEAWKEIHSAEMHGFNPNSALIDALSTRMKDPAK